MERAYRLFKLLADQKKDILDEDLISIVHHGAMKDVPRTFALEKMTGKFGGEWSYATVILRKAGEGEIRADGKGRRTDRGRARPPSTKS